MILYLLFLIMLLLPFLLLVCLLACLLVGYLERASAAKRGEAATVPFSFPCLLQAFEGILPVLFV